MLCLFVTMRSPKPQYPLLPFLAFLERPHKCDLVFRLTMQELLNIEQFQKKRIQKTSKLNILEKLGPAQGVVRKPLTNLAFGNLK